MGGATFPNLASICVPACLGNESSTVRMRRKLREGVELCLLADRMQLNDTNTGFAVELDVRHYSALTGAGTDTDRIWAMLESVGLADSVSELVEVRARQRDAFAKNNPPLLERIRDLLARATTEVPFFRDRKHLYDPSNLSAVEDFLRLPHMTKRDIRKSFPGGLIPNTLDVGAGLEDGSLTILVTSGSTEERIQIISRTVIDRLPFGSDDLLGIHIGGSQPRTALLTTPVCTAMSCRRAAGSFDERHSQNRLDLYLRTTTDPFLIDMSLIDAFCKDIERFQPAILAADPLYLQCLQRRARASGTRLPTIRLIQSGFEFGTRLARRDISSAFGAPILNDYGASEENRIAVECHRGSLHVRSDVVHVEILAQSGPCAPGEVGAVALTTFDTVTPLVRYLIGDLASWAGESCSCAFASWPALKFHGRANDLIRSKDSWITAEQLDEAIEAPEWLDFYRITQFAEDHFEMDLVPGLHRPSRFEEIFERLAPYIDPVKLRCRSVSHLVPLASMKIGTAQTRLPTPLIP